MKICECGDSYDLHDLATGTCNGKVDLEDWNVFNLPCPCEEFSYAYEWQKGEEI